MEKFDTYKENRDTDDFEGGPFFKMAYDELFKQCGIDTILSYDKLEADDCIAITTKEVLKKYPDAEIYIITSDMDYLQLMRENVHIYNLKYKLLCDSKTAFPDPEKNLFCKIVMGDRVIISPEYLQSVVLRLQRSILMTENYLLPNFKKRANKNCMREIGKL